MSKNAKFYQKLRLPDSAIVRRAALRPRALFAVLRNNKRRAYGDRRPKNKQHRKPGAEDDNRSLRDSQLAYRAAKCAKLL